MIRLRRPAALAAVVLISFVGLVGGASVGAQEPTAPPTTEAPATTTTTPATTTSPPPDEPTTTGPGTTSTTAAPGTTPTTAVPTTLAPDPEAPPAVPEDPGQTEVDGSGDDPTAPPTTLPTGPPPGFTVEQFETFVGVVEACGSDPGVVCSRLYRWTGNQVLAESTQWLTDLPLRILLVILVAVVANRLIRRAIASAASRWARRQEDAVEEDRTTVDVRHALRVATASSTLSSAATGIIYTFAALTALWQLNIDLTPFFAGAGIAGIALGFGAQNLVRDTLAGFFVIIEDQYGIGDTIDFGKATGVVESISLRVTKVRDVEGTLWFVPNGIISEVGNLSQRWARVILDVDVAYGADHHEAGRLIKVAADGMWRDPDCTIALLEEPELWGVESLGESAVVIRLAVKCAPARQWAAARELRSRIKDAFDEAGIEIPFPQQTMWLRNAPSDPDDS